MTEPLSEIHHVAVPVHDVERAVEWYRKRFDCHVSYQDETWAMLEFANVSLALVMPDQHPPHVAVADDQAGKYGRLTQHRDGTQSIYVEDPDHNAVELIVVDPPE